jgi:hypothetical protein
MSGKNLWISKVLVKFIAEDGETLGDKTVYVVSGKAAKAKVAAAMKETEDHPLMDERVHAYRTCEIIAEADCRSPGLADTLQEWGLEDDDLDDTVHDIASKRASDANNRGVGGQIEFIGMGEWLATQIAQTLTDNSGE